MFRRFLGSKSSFDAKTPKANHPTVEESLAAVEKEVSPPQGNGENSPLELLLGDSKGKPSTASPPPMPPIDGQSQPFENEVQNKRRSSKLKILLLLLLTLGFVWGSIKVASSLLLIPQGPTLTKLTKKKESLYCPLGFPLSGQEAQKELSRWGVTFETTPEGFLRGTTPSMTIVAESAEGGFVPLSLQVWSKDVPVKWGIRVSAKAEELQTFLGTPEEISEDRHIYKDSWNNTLIYTIQGNKVARIEWHYPKGLTFPEK